MSDKLREALKLIMEHGCTCASCYNRILTATADAPPEPTDEMVEAMATGISQVLSRYEDEGCNMQVPEFCAEWYEGFRNGLRAALAVQQKGEG